MMSVKPFEIDIPTTEVERLFRRATDTRPPAKDVVEDSRGEYGFETEWATKLYHYWLEEFSWENAQRRINSFNHFTTEIEGLNIHFIHQRSPHPDAIPILLIHGWPGSFYEFSDVIESLCNGSGESSPKFHCIVPSLPGFHYSDAPPRRGWTVKDTSRVFHTLLTERLGYAQYCVQAGDWGSLVARELGANPQYSSACKAIHLNFCPNAFPPELKDSDLTDRERRMRDRNLDWQKNHIAYAVLMRSRPQSVGWMFNDNPLGLFTFIGEKYFEGANPAIQSSTHWKDHILTTVCLYYFTNCIMTTSLIYSENVTREKFTEYMIAEENRIRCPFGFTSYAFDTSPSSQRAAERTGNLMFYRERDYAGHFACAEDPEGVVKDIGDFVMQHYSSG